MVKRYGKPSYGYGDFVEHILQYYKPYKKEIVYYEFEKDKQKIKDAKLTFFHQYAIKNP